MMTIVLDKYVVTRNHRPKKILAYEDAGFSVKEAEAYVGVLEEQDENLTSLL